MNRFPKISVIMPVYNESIHDLQESINSILNQTYYNFEFIIIDDNPKSNKIRNFLQMVKNKDHRIRLICNINNMGVVEASNKGVKRSKGKYIDRMDADDIAVKYKISNQLKFLTKNNLDLVCSNFSVMNLTDKVTRKYGYNSKTIVNQHKLRKIFMHCNIAMGPTLFFKRSKFLNVNGYRHTNVEDYDLASRFLIHKYRVGYMNQPLIYKRLRKDSISYNTILNQYIIMNTLSYYLRKFKFTKVVPIDVFKRNINRLTIIQIYKFNRFINIRYLLNNSKNIKNVFKLIVSIFSSIFVIKWCLWTVKNKYYQ